MFYNRFLTPYLYPPKHFSSSLQRFWGFDVSPPHILTVMRSGRNFLVRERAAGLCKDKPCICLAFLFVESHLLKKSETILCSDGGSICCNVYHLLKKGLPKL
jgi:hypothetical protein